MPDDNPGGFNDNLGRSFEEINADIALRMREVPPDSKDENPFPYTHNTDNALRVLAWMQNGHIRCMLKPRYNGWRVEIQHVNKWADHVNVYDGSTPAIAICKAFGKEIGGYR